MSFTTVCPGCGAVSNPSVGVCPYCKSVLSSGSHASGGIDLVLQAYNEGRMEAAVSLATDLLAQKPAVFDEPANAILFAKIMIEVEGPTSKTRAVLVQANAKKPGTSEIMDYLEILEAKSYLRDGPDPGESLLRNILRRSPDNVHAHFILGAHMFWTEHEPMKAVADLETCVRLRPQLMRAWACLGALYKQIGNEPLAKNALQKCLALETNPSMKEFLTKQLS